ncbi:LysR family transcriptional regulator [Bacillus sp. V3-13]|uniref:LysR family transcriptional regulator n=1 Tax=Bacillus sp. V3-13 TaxID=2053728 RepID=UPI0015E158FC|nr:LysR family transcriptional regulator [Bacillus sp. V3-13]
MELKNIEAFLMIAEKGSFSEAAEELNITQPTISVRIKQLEGEFNTILFKRTNGKKITLTDKGQEVYGYLKDAFTLIKKAEKTLKSGSKIDNNITISSPNHMGVNIMPELLKVLYKSYPNLDFKIKIEETKDTIELIKSGEVKFGLGYIYSEKEFESHNLIFVKVTDEENVLVCSPTHHLANKGMVNSEDLKNERIIIYNRNFFVTKSIENYLQELGIKTDKSLEINNVGWIKMMVRKGVGFTILQKMIVEDELKSGNLVKLNLPTPIPETPIYLIFNPETSTELMEIVTETLKRILVK